MGNRVRAPYKNYEVNQHKILEAYKKLQERDGIVLPSFEQLSKESGLSTRTIQRHFNKLDFGYVCSRERIHTPEVVNAIRKSANEGKARAQKLYAQIMEGYIERKDHKQEIVGDLNVNADISGELKVNIQRGIIKSPEDLQALQDVAKNYKATKAAAGEAPGEPVQTDEARDVDAEIFQELIEKTSTVNVDTMIFFK